MVWFNHVAFWHISSLEPQLREAMFALFGEDNLAYNMYYGDGTRIEDSIIAEINEAYRQETIKFPWQHGDVLMLDNMLVAHGRSPFVGPRKILVAMGDAYTRSDFNSQRSPKLTLQSQPVLTGESIRPCKKWQLKKRSSGPTGYRRSRNVCGACSRIRSARFSGPSAQYRSKARSTCRCSKLRWTVWSNGTTSVARASSAVLNCGFRYR